MGNPKGVRRDFAALEKRRMKALGLFRESERSQDQIARRLGVAQQTVSRWQKRYEAQGRDGLKRADRAGRPPRLRGEQLARLRQLLLQNPEEHGYRTNLWTCARVADLIQKQFAVQYHPGHVWKLLGAMRFSCQRPVGRARERREREIQEWKKKRWPEIKKKPRKKAAPSSSSTRVE